MPTRDPQKYRLIANKSKKIKFVLPFFVFSGKINSVVAAVAELADAQRSGRCILTGVQVRLLPAALSKKALILQWINAFCLQS